MEQMAAREVVAVVRLDAAVGVELLQPASAVVARVALRGLRRVLVASMEEAADQLVSGVCPKPKRRHPALAALVVWVVARRRLAASVALVEPVRTW